MISVDVWVLMRTYDNKYVCRYDDQYTDDIRWAKFYKSELEARIHRLPNEKVVYVTITAQEK